MGRVSSSPSMRDIIAPIVREELEARAPGPLLVSQKSALVTLGLPPRVFLQLARRPDCPVEVQKVGKLRLVSAGPFAAWLRQLGEVDGVAAPDDTQAVDEADSILRELGLRTVAGARR